MINELRRHSTFCEKEHVARPNLYVFEVLKGTLCLNVNEGGNSASMWRSGGTIIGRDIAIYPCTTSVAENVRIVINRNQEQVWSL